MKSLLKKWEATTGTYRDPVRGNGKTSVKCQHETDTRFTSVEKQFSSAVQGESCLRLQNGLQQTSLKSSSCQCHHDIDLCPISGHDHDDGEIDPFYIGVGRGGEGGGFRPPQ